MFRRVLIRSQFSSHRMIGCQFLMRSEFLAAEAFGDRDQTGRFREVLAAYRRQPYFYQSISDDAGETCWSGCSTIVLSSQRAA